MIVSLSGKEGYLSLRDIGYGSADGFMGVNCRHNWYPYFEGASKKFWNDDLLREVSPFRYQGKDYDEYTAYQRLRNLDKSIRKHERKANLYKAVGDEEAETIENIKKQRLKQEKSNFQKVVKSNSELANDGNAGYNISDKDGIMEVEIIG